MTMSNFYFRIIAKQDKENVPEGDSQQKAIDFLKPTPRVKSMAKKEMPSDLISARNLGSTGPQTVMAVSDRDDQENVSLTDK